MIRRYICIVCQIQISLISPSCLPFKESALLYCLFTVPEEVVLCPQLWAAHAEGKCCPKKSSKFRAFSSETELDGIPGLFLLPFKCDQYYQSRHNITEPYYHNIPICSHMKRTEFMQARIEINRQSRISINFEFIGICTVSDSASSDFLSRRANSIIESNSTKKRTFSNELIWSWGEIETVLIPNYWTSFWKTTTCVYTELKLNQTTQMDDETNHQFKIHQ